MADDRADLSASRTRPGGSTDPAAFDHGRFPPGTVLAGRYRIVGLLGRGGMGEVYRADDLTLGLAVALKFLPAQLDTNRTELDRLLSEVRTARQVSHPNVCRVHDVGRVDGRHFISMEYVDGEDLSVLLRRIGHLPADKGVEIARQLCAGLAVSHQCGVLHRDLKPANIMLDGRGRVRITDFGLATALQADGRGVEEVAGTPAYMAPEQLDGKPVSIQSDIYALGLVLYEIFTGRRLHNGSTVAQLRERHAASPFVDLSSTDLLDPAVARIIERCLESEPSRRPRSCAVVAASLPGADPLAAAIAAGETPSPQLVAAAGVQGGMSPRRASLLGSAFIALLVVVSLGHWNAPRQFGVTRSAEVLSAQTRDFLASLGYPDAPVDTASGFSSRPTAWARGSLSESARPWSALAAQRPAAVFFWYREQPSAMASIDMGQIGLEQGYFILRGVTGVRPEDPPLEPGSIYVERGPDGSLDVLYVRPLRGKPANAAAPTVDWSRLFAEARLDMTTFTPAPPDPALAFAGSRRTAWGREATSAAGALRVEAAELDGRPVVFRVLGPNTPIEFSSSRWVTVSERSRSASIAAYAGLVFLLIGYAGVAYFTHRNIVLGRGDRRGAARLALVIGTLMFASGLMSAALSIDLRILGTLNGCVSVALFTAGCCWVFYLAIEPFVRRQWPRMLVGWSRLLAGEWRDPQVGREVFLGGLTTIATSSLTAGAAWIAVRSGNEPPIDIDFYFRGLGSVRELLAGLLQVLPSTVMIALLLMVLLLVLRRLLRSDLAAFVALSVLLLGIATTGEWAFIIASTLPTVVSLVVALRIGFLALVTNRAVALIVISFPIFPNTPGLVGNLSWIPLGAILVPMVFGWYTSLAGQSIFGDAKAE